MGTIRQQRSLPPKIEQAFAASQTRRAKCSRDDYAAGFEDGYRQALEEMQRGARKLNGALLKATPNGQVLIP